ncbi:MAG: TSUP family transporter [Woeseiaceae bacterium]
MDLIPINGAILAAILIAISLGSLLKGMTGLGLPIFAVPAIATITSVEEAVVLMIIPGIAANLWLVISHRKYHALLKEHLPFLTMGFVGGILGTTLLLVIDDRWLKLLLAIWLGIYLVQYIRRSGSLDIFRGRGRLAYLIGLLAGTMQGANGISAQLVAPYYHGRSLQPAAYAFLVTSTFLLFSSAQMTAVLGTGLLTVARLKLSLAALVPTLIFTRVGIGLAGKLSQTAFNRILLLTLFLMEIKLIVDVM